MMPNSSSTEKSVAQKVERPKRLRDQFREWLVFHHYSRRSVDTYTARVLDFVMWSGKRDPWTMGAPEVNAYLSHLANERHVTAGTQKLLGHSRLETTMIYNHVAVPAEKRIKSPLDL